MESLTEILREVSLTSEKALTKISSEDIIKTLKDNSFKNGLLLKLTTYYKPLCANNKVNLLSFAEFGLKYLRYVVDAVESCSSEDGVKVLTQSCCIVTTAHVVCTERNSTSNEKVLKLLFHILKQLYKKMSLDGMKVLSQCMTSQLVHTHEISDELRKFMYTAHQMCLSVYVTAFKAGRIDAQLFSLRSDALIVLSYSDWMSNKFLDVAMAFVSQWTQVVVRKTIGNEAVVAKSTEKLIARINYLHETTQSDSSLKQKVLELLWKTVVFYYRINLQCKSVDTIKKSILNVYDPGIVCFVDLLDFINPVLSMTGENCCTKETLATTNKFSQRWQKVLKSDSSELFAASIIDVLITHCKQNLCFTRLHLLAKTIEGVLIKGVLEGCIMFFTPLFTVLQRCTNMLEDCAQATTCFNNTNTNRETFIANVLQLGRIVTQKIESIPLKTDDCNWLSKVALKLCVEFNKKKEQENALTAAQLALALSEKWLVSQSDEIASQNQDEIVTKFNNLIGCLTRLESFSDAYKVNLTLLKRSTQLQGVEEATLKSQMEYHVKLKLQMAEDNDKKSVVEVINLDNDSDLYITVLLFEYGELKRRSCSNAWLSTTLHLMIEHYEAQGDTLNYALLLIERSTLPAPDRAQRVHWCNEAIAVLQGMDEELRGSNDTEEYSNKSMLASAYFQSAILEYEALIEVEEESLLAVEEEEAFLATLSRAVELWKDVLIEQINSIDEELFTQQEKVGEILYQIAVLYSLHCQNFDAIKASYLSGFVYEIIITQSKEDVEQFRSKQATSWSFCASQLLVVGDTQQAQMLLERVTNENQHVELVKAAVMIRSGKIEPSVEVLNRVVDSNKTNHSRTAFSSKADAYYLISCLKLTYTDLQALENSTESHMLSKSPFPPLADCLKYLRSLYVSSITNEQSNESTVWCVLDKLITCLLHNAELYKHQGYIPQAKALYREALQLAEKFKLSTRRMSITQHIASLDLIAHNEKMFYENFDTTTKILKDSIGDCFDDTMICLPQFVNHNTDCSCLNCSRPIMQEINIRYYLQYIQSEKQFHNNTITASEIVDGLIENANSRFNALLAQTKEILDLSPKKTKSTARKKKKRNVATSVDNFTRYSAEAKIINPTVDSARNELIDTVEMLIQHVKKSDLTETTQHEYRRLIAQLYCLRSVLNIGEEVVSKTWNDKENIHEEDLALAENEKDNRETLREREELIEETEVLKPKRCVKKTTKRATTRSRKTPSVENESEVSFTEKPKLSNRRNKKTTLKRDEINEKSAQKTHEINQELALKSNKINEKSTLKSNKINEKSALKTVEQKIYETQSFDISSFTGELEHALSLLNPYTDTLIIKSIYHLISLISGVKSKRLTTNCQLLATSRTLHQQLLYSYSQRIRKTKDQNEELDMNLMATCELIEKYSSPGVVFADVDVQQLADTYIPEEWVVVNMSISQTNNGQHLIVSRVQPNTQTVFVKIDISNTLATSQTKEVMCDLESVFHEDLIETFDAILNASRESMLIKNKKQWWDERLRLDKQMQSLCRRMEVDWLKGWEGILLGQHFESHVTKEVHILVQNISAQFSKRFGCQVDSGLVKVLVNGYLFCNSDVSKPLRCLLGEHCLQEALQIFTKTADKKNQLSSTNHGLVVLVLDRLLQRLPWENIPTLRGHPVVRMPSLLLTAIHCKNYRGLLDVGVTDSTYYILNPKSDLKRTEEKFADWFKNEGWTGITGKTPTVEQYKSALTDYDIFIYCGHGSGEEYLSWSAVQQLQCRAVSILMGCSSGRLLVRGHLEAYGMVLCYLLAGCPAVVANLWDVTDKDIDLYLESLLNNWLTKDCGKNNDLAQCVSASREACCLDYLTGSAPVVYGLPLKVRHS